MKYRLPLLEAGVELHEVRALLGELKSQWRPAEVEGF
jgi:hypothetical protein